MKGRSMTEIHGETGLYAVDALDRSELAAFEAHRATCPTCHQEAAELCETAPRMSVLAGAPLPPPELRAAILAGLDDVRQLPPLRTEPGRPHEPADDDLAARRASRRTRLLSVLVAAVSVVALALGGVAYSAARQPQGLVAGASADTSLLAAPDAQILPLVLANGAQVSFVVSKTQNRALFVGGDLPSPGAGKTYELWTLRGSSASPDALVGGGTDVVQWFHGPVSGSTGVAVSIEDAGGARRPTAVQGVVTI